MTLKLVVLRGFLWDLTEHPKGWSDCWRPCAQTYVTAACFKLLFWNFLEAMGECVHRRILIRRVKGGLQWAFLLYVHKHAMYGLCCLAETSPRSSLALQALTHSYQEKKRPFCWLEVSNNILTSVQQFKMNYSAHRSCYLSSQHISAHLLLSVHGGDIIDASGKGAHGLGVGFGP